jgi:hypothetical protein
VQRQLAAEQITYQRIGIARRAPQSAARALLFGLRAE